MAIDLSAARLALQPYLFWIKVSLLVLFAALFFGTGWFVNGWRWEAKENQAIKDLQAQVDKDRVEYLREKAKWDAKALVDEARIQSLDTQKDMLLATIGGLKMTRTIKVEPNAQGECVSDVLDTAFRVRWNEVVTSNATVAAAKRSD